MTDTPSPPHAHTPIDGVPSADVGWARASLARTMRLAVLVPVAGMHLMQAIAIGLADGVPGWQRIALAGNLVALVLAARAARRTTGGVWPVVVASYVMLLGGWVVAPSMSGIVAFTSAWLGNATVAVASLLLRRPWAAVVPPVMGVVTGASILLPNPGWAVEIPLAAAFTPTAITIVCLRGRRLLEQLMAQAEVEAADQLRVHESSVAARTAIATAAETARTLHDTVVNTLGALAAGAAGLADLTQVRRRCAADVEATRALLQRHDAEVGAADVLAGLADHVPLRVHRRGLVDRAVEDLLERQPPDVRRALRGAVREALTNAHKHAEVDEVEVQAVAVQQVDVQPADVQPADLPVGGAGAAVLEVRVIDRGRGLDPAAGDGLGLQQSIRGRCADVGIGSTITSAPGEGTTVVLRCPPTADHRPDGAPGPESLATVVRDAQRRAGFLWAGGVAAVGAMIEVVNNLGRPSLTWAMVLVLAGLVGLARLTTRAGGSLPAWVSGVVVAAVPAVFVLSIGGVDFMRAENIHNWQALGVTGPLILVMYASRTLRPLGLGVLMTLGSGVVTTVLLLQAGADHATVVPFGVGAALAVVGGLLVFRQAMAVFGTRAAREEAQAQADQVDAAARRAAEQARRRWRTAGLEVSIGLLDGVAGGASDPRDEALQAACRREERHLRQLLLLSHELIHLGPWLSRASALARDRGVELSLRTGDQDAPDALTGDGLGQVVLDAVLAAPPGSAVTVGLFVASPGPRLTVMHPTSDLAAHPVDVPAGWSSSRRVVGARTLLEVHPVGAADLIGDPGEIGQTPPSVVNSPPTP